MLEHAYKTACITGTLSATRRNVGHHCTWRFHTSHGGSSPNVGIQHHGDDSQSCTVHTQSHHHHLERQAPPLQTLANLCPAPFLELLEQEFQQVLTHLQHHPECPAPFLELLEQELQQVLAHLEHHPEQLVLCWLGQLPLHQLQAHHCLLKVSKELHHGWYLLLASVYPGCPLCSELLALSALSLLWGGVPHFAPKRIAQQAPNRTAS